LPPSSFELVQAIVEGLSNAVLGFVLCEAGAMLAEVIDAVVGVDTHRDISWYINGYGRP
jgi:hypothetical protein